VAVEPLRRIILGLGVVLVLLAVGYLLLTRGTGGGVSSCNVCVGNLRMLHAAKRRFIAAQGSQAHGIRWDDIDPYCKGGYRACTNCPSGGVVTLNGKDELPSCSIHEHQEAFEGWVRDYHDRRN